MLGAKAPSFVTVTTANWLHPRPRMFLTEAYASLGRKTDAARERATAKRLGARYEE